MVKRDRLLQIILLLIGFCSVSVLGESRGKINSKTGEVELLSGEKVKDAEDSVSLFEEEDPWFTWYELDKSPENPIFFKGETLEYRVSWMGITAGTVSMSLEIDKILDNRPVYKAIVIGKTNKTFSFFFTVKDKIVSYFDKGTFNSINYVKEIREGSYRKCKETVYDQLKKTAKVKDRIFSIPPNSKDPLACIYALRRFAGSPGKVIRMNSNSEGKSNFPVEIGFSEKIEIKLDDDINRMAVVGRPLPTWKGRVFEKKKSEVVIWFSDDEYFVPLRLESKVRIGKLRADLIRRSGPGWNINVKKD